MVGYIVMIVFISLFLLVCGFVVYVFIRKKILLKNSISITIEDHERPLARVFAEAKNLSYDPLKTLDDARAYSDGIVVMEGDWGGQIYLVCHANKVMCSEEKLRQLLIDLDTIAWSCNELEGSGIYYERRAVGSGICGGMGGGGVTNEIWIHEEFNNIRHLIEGVIKGERDRIDI